MSNQSALSLFSPAEQPSLYDVAETTWKQYRGKRTWENDQNGLRHWERCFPALPAVTITVDHCRRFRRFLDADKSIDTATANKICRAVNRFLKLIGPDDGSIDPADIDALQPVPLLDKPVKIKAPRIPYEETENAIELDESGLFLAAAAEARWTNHRNRRELKDPPRLAAPRWWHETWIFFYNTALRPDEALQVLPGDLFTDRQQRRWLNVRKEVAKNGVARDVYLNQWACAAVDTLLMSKGRTILGWEYGQNWLDDCRRQIYDRAGLDRLLDLKIGFKGLRKACATELTSLSSVEIAGKHLGHVTKNVTSRHYVKRDAVIPHVDRLPQPQIGNLPPAVIEHHDSQLRFNFDGFEFL